MKENTITKPHLHGNQAQSLGLRSFGSLTLTRPGKTRRSEAIELCNCIWRRQSHFYLVCPIRKPWEFPCSPSGAVDNGAPCLREYNHLTFVTFLSDGEEGLRDLPFRCNLPFLSAPQSFGGLCWYIKLTQARDHMLGCRNKAAACLAGRSWFEIISWRHVLINNRHLRPGILDGFENSPAVFNFALVHAIQLGRRRRNMGRCNRGR